MGFVTELVALDDLAGTVKSTDRVTRHAEDFGRLLRAYALPFGDVHSILQSSRVSSIIRCAVSIMLEIRMV
jgi:hypothetical protein